MFLKNLEIIAETIMDYVQVTIWAHQPLSWDAMLNMTKMELELISDPDMYIFFEKGMRGGVFLFVIDIVRPKISIWNLMTQTRIKTYYVFRRK